MAVDHLIFNKLKWWQANEAPLIGKHAEVKSSAENVYIFESPGASYAIYPAYSDTDGKRNIQSGTIRGEMTSAKIAGTGAPSDVHMVCIEPTGKYWYKVEDVTISGGY